MQTETRNYFCGETKHHGFYAYPTTPKKEPRPAVIVVHAWMGQDNFARQKAQDLAKLGYVGFAADIYGEGILAKSPDEAKKLMEPFFMDRELLQQRIIAAFEEVNQNPAVDSKKIGAIGFCFGGLTVIELFRSGTPVKGAVSFHGGFAYEKDGHKANIPPIAKDIKGSLLILHGYEDPSVSQSDIQTLQKELDNAKTDWQIDVYGQTMHAFTNPEQRDPKSGLLYNAKADKRSWRSMCNFFEEAFGTTAI